MSAGDFAKPPLASRTLKTAAHRPIRSPRQLRFGWVPSSKQKPCTASPASSRRLVRRDSRSVGTAAWTAPIRPVPVRVTSRRRAHASAVRHRSVANAPPLAATSSASDMPHSRPAGGAASDRSYAPPPSPMRALPASSRSFCGAHSRGGPDKDRAARHPHGMTDQHHVPNRHAWQLEDPDESRHPWSQNRTENLTPNQVQISGSARRSPVAQATLRPNGLSPREPPSPCPAWNISPRSRGPSLARKRSRAQPAGCSGTARPTKPPTASVSNPAAVSGGVSSVRPRSHCAMLTPGRPARVP